MESGLDRLMATLNAVLQAALGADDFDLTLGANGEVDVSTDDWTLHVEDWPDAVAWLAIDDEPDDPAQFAAARRSVMGVEVERALAQADTELGGALIRALTASDDPLTHDFAAALCDRRTPP